MHGVGETVRLADIPRPNASRQAVGCVVGALQQFIPIVEGRGSHDRAKDFFLHDGQAVVLVREDGGGEKIAVCQIAAQAFAAGNKLRPTAAPALDIAQDAL